MPLGETIVAQSSAKGAAAIAIIRASGPLCREFVRDCMGREAEIVANRAYVGNYKNIKKCSLDRVVYVFYEAERSYTGELSLEINCHGNPLIIKGILEDLVLRGARMAEPGEFTKTAFLNNKLDLSQAEAVCDLITAKSEAGVQAAQRQLAGALGEKINQYIEDLLQIIAEIEAYIDFPEDDLPPEEMESVARRMGQMKANFQGLIDTHQYKSILQEGVKTVILGAPNVGKSTLLNTLLGEERAIVSDVPGTTRDFISEQIMIGPYAMRIMDTAGVHETEDRIEQMGIAKTLERAKDSDLCLLMVDGSRMGGVSEKILEHLNWEKTLVIENKIDLAKEGESIEEWGEGIAERCRVSLKTGVGVGELKEILEKRIGRLAHGDSEGELVVNARHVGALKKAVEHVSLGLKELKEMEQLELAANELHQVLVALGEIVGGIDNERMLDKLFSTFCIGK